MNLPDAQNHPAFAYRPETGEEPFASMLAVPVRRAGRTLGVVAVQNRNPRRYSDEEVDELETVAMLLAEVLAAAGAADGAGGGRRGHGAAGVLRRDAGPRHRHRPGGAARRPASPGCGCWPTIPMPNWRGCTTPTQRMQQGLDELIAGAPDGLRSGADGIGVARGARGLSPGRGRCRLAAGGSPR